MRKVQWIFRENWASQTQSEQGEMRKEVAFEKTWFLSRLHCEPARPKCALFTVHTLYRPKCALFTVHCSVYTQYTLQYNLTLCKLKKTLSAASTRPKCEKYGCSSDSKVWTIHTFFIAKYISVNETEKHILSESFTRENDVEAGPGVVAI